jgi:hypothetical protein
MCWRVALLLGLVMLTALSGCRHGDLVEAELRTREKELRELRAELSRSEWQNDALHREMGSIRQGASAKLPPELASQTYTLKSIVIGRGTAGYDDDGHPGDEALRVVVEPKDGDGHTIKAPGSLHVEAWQSSTEGIKIPLCSWDLESDQVRRSWHSGFLSTGYTFILPWKTWPTFERIRVIARFTLVDRRIFEAEKDITIRLPPGHQQRVTPPSLESPVPADPEPVGPALPQPRPVEPTKSTSAKAWWELPGRAALRQPPAHNTPAVEQTKWRPVTEPQASIADSVRLLHPVPLTFGPGENPDP